MGMENSNNERCSTCWHLRTTHASDGKCPYASNVPGSCACDCESYENKIDLCETCGYPEATHALHDFRINGQCVRFVSKQAVDPIEDKFDDNLHNEPWRNTSPRVNAYLEPATAAMTLKAKPMTGEIFVCFYYNIEQERLRDPMITTTPMAELFASPQEICDALDKANELFKKTVIDLHKLAEEFEK